MIAESWRARDPSLYGRMDFAWCGNAPVKLLEYNADTPTSLYESAYFQWLWLEDARRSGIIPRDADQYNAIQERLISRFSELYSREPFYFCCCQDTDEDRSTVLYLQDCAQQAGQESRFIYIEDLGLGVGGVLTDLDDNVIQRAFKLYPLEWMMRDDNGPLLRKRREQWVEPLWKSILSNKGLMPLLWRFFLVILTFLHPGLRVKNRRLPLAKAMCVNRSTRAKAEMSPFSTARITSLTTLMVITPMNR